ncbi:MAG: hypothetical protein JO010_00115, partial [Alphaproteobacteria bacterium]|nr:hypothetical protein [Alphaproteobacteria bacterium]
MHIFSRIAVIGLLAFTVGGCTTGGGFTGLAPTKAYKDGLEAGTAYAKEHPTGLPETIIPTHGGYSDYINNGADLLEDGKIYKDFRDGFLKAVAAA